MANSPLTINNQSDKAARPLQSAKRASSSAGGRQASFADVMAAEQNARSQQGAVKNTSSAQKRPTVARLPEAGIPLAKNTVLAGRSPNDLLRMQVFNKASADLTRTRSLNNVARAASGTSAGDVARDMNTAANLRTIAAGGNSNRGFALSSADFIHTSRRVAKTEKAKTRKQTQNANNNEAIGKLSAKFESGSDGIAAIGYDGTGGTSYGKYQIASKVGSMKSFLTFLDSEAPDLAKRLRQSGPANTGSRRGAMPDTWRAIAKEQPERFEQLQESFIRESHYKPALAAIDQRTGIDASSLSPAMREVIWSTAVQHGPAGAARIFERADAMSGKAQDASYERKMITNVYNVRSGQFGSSTNQVRESVRNRFKEEKQLALNMLDNAARQNRA